MENKVTISAHAKINLTLQITGRRNDGYHTLKSVMQSVSLHDIVTVTRDNSGLPISVSCTDEKIPCGSGNIAYKAAEAFFAAAGVENTGIHIHIVKNIPSEAGLGGGSADGAAVIFALDRLYNTDLGEEKLCEIGAKVGADVPFCIKGGTVLCEGIGEIMSPLAPLPQCTIVIGKGSGGVSTKEAYAAIDRMGRVSACDFEVSAFDGGIVQIAKVCSNVFEYAMDIDEIKDVRGIIAESGALCAVMSGSGSAVYGIFTDNAAARACAERLAASGYYANICQPIPFGLSIV